MAKTLSFTDTSPRTVKIGDTTTSFTLICGNDNVATDLTNVTSITVKLGNASGYLKSATIDPASLTDPTTGQVTVKFNADLMTSLPAGSYAIEIWVVDSTGTSIYPSDGSTGFTITNNIQSTNGTTITTITFDDFVQAMNKAASTIAKGDKGDKGDTGTVDNAGLTTAPAFVNLQTQVNNSAVGTNLILGTSRTPITVTGTSWAVEKLGDFKELVVGQTYTASASIGNADHNVELECYSINANGDRLSHVANPIILAPNSRGSVSFTWEDLSSSGVVGVMIDTAWTNDKDSGSYQVFGVKLEKGNIATDWCPNPSEILTQSDYAKIKAAIVALGGSLS